MGEMVSYPNNGGTGTGYLALPGSGPGPGVVLIQEWWGLVGHITSVADRLAEAGFAVLAPDLYHGESASEPDEAGKLLMEMALDTAARDIAGAADHLASLPQTIDGSVGTVGFCMGGSLALWSATLSDRVTTAVAFYPGATWERLSPRWDRLAGKVADIHCSEGDGTSAAPGIQTLQAKITAAGGSCTLYDYPGTKHAFFNDDRPEVYDADAAASAWARTLDTLRTRLG